VVEAKRDGERDALSQVDADASRGFHSWRVYIPPPRMASALKRYSCSGDAAYSMVRTTSKSSLVGLSAGGQIL
jgi:hypothetical protein